MKNLTHVRTVLLGLCLWALYGYSPVSAEELVQCDTICSPSESCETECQNDLFDTTCGNYNGGSSSGQCVGFCGDYYCNAYQGENSSNCEDDCGACTPNWVLIDEDVVGAWEEDDYPVKAEHWVLYVDTYSDSNNCPNSSNYQSCRPAKTTTIWSPPYAGYICSNYQCGGTTTCPL